MEVIVYAFLLSLCAILIAMILILVLAIKGRWKLIAVTLSAAIVGALAGYFVPIDAPSYMLAKFRGSELMIQITGEEIQAVMGAAIGLLVAVLVLFIGSKRSEGSPNV